MFVNYVSKTFLFSTLSINMAIKPNLIDYSLIVKEKPKMIQKAPPIKPSFWINLIICLLLIIGGLCMYQRYINKEKYDMEKQTLILGLHQYVKEKI